MLHAGSFLFAGVPVVGDEVAQEGKLGPSVPRLHAKATPHKTHLHREFGIGDAGTGGTSHGSVHEYRQRQAMRW